EDDEVVELPVEDRARRQPLQLVDLELHAAATQAVEARRVEDGEGGCAVAADAHDRAELVESHRLVVVRQDHRETGGPALGRGELLYDRNASRAPARVEPAKRGKAL